MRAQAPGDLVRGDAVPGGRGALLLTGVLLAIALTLLTLVGARAADARPAEAQQREGRAHVPAGARARAAVAPRLRFGIYPGGGAGLVEASGEPRPEDPALRLAALQRLRGEDRDLVLHLYSEWTGDLEPQEAVARALAEVEDYGARGFLVEPVIRFRPTAADPGRTVPAFVAHVRAVVAQLARHPGVVAVQIVNEANVAGAPAAADGAYAGARAALVRGVIAADRQARASGRRDIRIGFNWAAAGNTGPDLRFWRDLRRLGGRPFAAAVDWVGVDIYPGTWSAGRDEPGAVQQTMASVLRYLRLRALPAAGLGRRVALQICENGFPTGATRDEPTQALLLRAAIEAVDRLRGAYHVTDYRWFDLRDAISGRAELEHGYGVLRDDYSEKPGFAVLAGLIARLGS